MTPRPTLAFSRPDPALESDHRIADSLAMVPGLVRSQASSIDRHPRPFESEEVRIMFAELGGRLEAVAHLCRELADHPAEAAIDLGEYLRDISAAVVAALSGDRDIHLQFACDGYHHVLPPDRALSIGFLVVELVTNAVKYAHPTGVPGEINVSCNAAADRAVIVEVSDDGVGLPEGLDPMNADSLGLRLVRSLAAQLDARLDFAQSGLGLSCVLQIPAPSPA